MLNAHLGEFYDIQCSLHDALDDRTSGWRKGITELLHSAEDAEDSGRDDFSRLGHRCSGRIAVPGVHLMGLPTLGVCTGGKQDLLCKRNVGRSLHM